MTDSPAEPPATDYSDVAAEPPEESLAEQHDVVGEGPGGDTVPEDDAQ